MPGTHHQVLLHLVFATKNREPMLIGSIADEVHRYLIGTARGLGSTSVITGGWVDHIHMLVKHRVSMSVSDFMRELKSSSSRFASESLFRFSKFGWQDGYGAFSVSPGQCDAVVRYIQNQKVHHSQFSFEEEYVGMLDKAGVEYDSKYLWD